MVKVCCTSIAPSTGYISSLPNLHSFLFIFQICCRSIIEFERTVKVCRTSIPPSSGYDFLFSKSSLFPVRLPDLQSIDNGIQENGGGVP
ncbi:hypothetical protein Nepgr_009013 [Nepenthes gracilis]|uniref:Uncharacterized protein n=1 Tax=Nepenthes gracilis TaxID=150966 RepID=A0AAD3S9L7_NEPGR|nr:hypothetical protein Nepgr_009013 [Nepenthes gracilis]